MPISRRPEGSYQVTVSVGGRTVRKSSRHWTHADAKAVERQLLAQAADAAAGRQPQRTIADALARWLTEHVPKLRSARQTRNHARMLLPFIRGRKLTEAPAVWAEIKAAMADKAPATINHKGRILRQLCRLAQREWTWVDAPIGERIKLLPETPVECFLTRAQVDQLVAACSLPAAGDLILLASYTGVRRGQMLRIEGATMVRDGMLHLDRSGKSRRPLVIPLHPRVRDIAAAMPLRISEPALRAEWDAARAATGLRHVRWHDLRHTCASWLVQAGVSLKVVQEILGHSTIAVTQRYAHLAPEHLRDAIAKLA